jgi:hypothetical protein
LAGAACPRHHVPGLAGYLPGMGWSSPRGAPFGPAGRWVRGARAGCPLRAAACRLAGLVRAVSRRSAPAPPRLPTCRVSEAVPGSGAATRAAAGSGCWRGLALDRTGAGSSAGGLVLIEHAVAGVEDQGEPDLVAVGVVPGVGRLAVGQGAGAGVGGQAGVGPLTGERARGPRARAMVMFVPQAHSRRCGPSQWARAACWGVGKEAARGRNPWYTAWSARRSHSALVPQTAPNVENNQRRDQQQQPRLRLMTPPSPTPGNGRHGSSGTATSSAPSTPSRTSPPTWSCTPASNRASRSPRYTSSTATCALTLN